MKTIRLCINWKGARGNNDNPTLDIFHYDEEGDISRMSPTHLRQLLHDRPTEVSVEVAFGDGQETRDAMSIMDTLGVATTGPFVKARAYSDDHKASEDFDASLWFERATHDEIMDLARCGWGGDYPADRVAQFMAEHDKKVGGIFQYLDVVNASKTECGFECHIDIDSAMAWLDANKPELAKALRADEDIETKGALMDFHMQ